MIKFYQSKCVGGPKDGLELSYPHYAKRVECLPPLHFDGPGHPPKSEEDMGGEYVYDEASHNWLWHPEEE